MKRRDVVVIICIMLFTPILLAVLVQPHWSDMMVEREREQKAFAKESFSREVSDGGSIRQKIDASEDKWVYYSFEAGVVPAQSEGLPRDNWELAFKRKKIVSNSGVLNRSGSVGVINLGKVEFSEVTVTPKKGYILNTVEDGNIVNTAIGKWYDYDIWRHILVPKGDVYLVKTSGGRIAKMKIEGYYCGRKKAACYDIRFSWSNG